MQHFRSAFAAVVLLIAVASFSDKVHLVQAQPGSKDWIDPPFTGQGQRPQNGTTVFISCYLDRLLTVNQVDYGFQVFLGSDLRQGYDRLLLVPGFAKACRRGRLPHCLTRHSYVRLQGATMLPYLEPWHVEVVLLLMLSN